MIYSILLRKGKKQFLLFLWFLAFLAPGTYASSLADKPVKGNVKDEKNAGIPGVNVRIKGQNVAATTDASGNFVIKTKSENDVLVFSFVGYTTKEITVGNQSEINVTLEVDVNNWAK
ncbi:carboxypeptidase-like regulatory domain-containing protein [Pseudarcicella hirudinis]|uniref:carboxypeptidase-like regulatory domain-containing protein n=1 Tax=Pseudarcicella hirudinis TaxID=1079859 RepID=UPI0035E7CA20